ERSTQLVREHGDHLISCSACELDRVGVAFGCRLKFSQHADIADVALDHFGCADKVDVADKLDLDLLAALRAERVVFVPDVLLCLQLLESGLIRCNVLEQADLPELEADYAFERIV